MGGSRTSAQSRKSAANEKLEQYKQFAELNQDEQVRQLRKYEEKIARLQSEKQGLSKRKTQAEFDKQDAERRFELMLATQTPDKVKSFKKVRADSGSKTRPTTPILCLNDWHAEERVTLSQTNGQNRFDLKTCEQRVEQTGRKAVEFLELWKSNWGKPDNMVVWLGGDMITGYIHEELAQTNFSTPEEAMYFAQRLVISLLNYLKEHAPVPHIHVVTNSGNHGRTTRKKQHKNGQIRSYDWLIYQNVAQYFADDKFFSFNVGSSEFVYEKIQGWTFRFHHGDTFRYSGGVGGVTVTILREIGKMDQTQKADWDIFGHFHQFIHHPRFVLCGSLMGVNEFSHGTHQTSYPPAQTLIFVDRQHGVNTALPLYCASGSRKR
jgi:hypothetical protein